MSAQLTKPQFGRDFANMPLDHNNPPSRQRRNPRHIKMRIMKVDWDMTEPTDPEQELSID
jgi:hypothetical protein